MDLSLIIPAFIAGIFTFLAPCTLPLLPAYLGFISGVSLDELENPAKAKQVKRKIFFNGLFFIIGFSLVFIVLGTLAGFIGHSLLPYRFWLARIGGVFVIIFGLFMLNVLKINFLAKEKQIKIPFIFGRGKPLSSLVLGSAFGFGWTPCAGPILGSVLLLASTSTTAFQGAFLLTIFSAGLAVPFLAIAAIIGSAQKYLAKTSPYLKIISFIGGLFLVFLGVLLLTNKMGIWIAYFFRVFDFINYDRLLDYL